MDWISHKKHRAQVATDFGQWVGLIDENGVPIMDLPPVIELTAPETRNSPSSFKATLGTLIAGGRVHPVVDDLIGPDLGKTDSTGLLVPSFAPTRFIVVERPGASRLTYRVTHSEASGGVEYPSRLTVNGVDLLSVYAGIPAFSAPTTVSGTWTRFERDWAGPENVAATFSKPRDLQDLKMSTVADGATIEGPAEATIKRLIGESLDAAFKAIGITSDPPMQLIPGSSGLSSPLLLIRPTDKSLWEELASLAHYAGVRLTANMWWPGDAIPAGMTLSQPTILLNAIQSEEVI